MISLHAQTLSLMLVVVTVTTSALLLLAWLQNREVSSLGWWAFGNLIAAVAMPLFGLRGVAPPFVSIDLANLVLIMSFALMWAGFRRFAGGSVSLIGLLSPALFWMALCRWDVFYASVEWRVVVCSTIIAGYSLASAFELYRVAGERLWSRYLAICWLLIHAAFFGARIPLTLFTSPPGTNDVVASPWFWILTFEGVLNVVALSFLQIAMIRERAENHQREAALTDLLTNAPNRRALFLEGARLLARSQIHAQQLCALLIDIDHFKAINDRFGHDGGDAILIGVANTMRAHLRGEDFFGRLGGEEFVCLLPNTSMAAAAMVAEGLRARVANMKLVNADSELRVSISIGVACAAGPSIDTLLAAADRNLYEAKAAGRNRISALEEPPPSTAKLRVA